MGAALAWYGIVTGIGWLAWPLAYRLLPGLPDRGYTFSRTLGLLLVGFVFWLLASLGFLHNTPGGMLFSAAIVLGLAIWACRSASGGDGRLVDWIKSEAGMLLAAELLFLAAFAGWTVVRAYNPEIFGTEKPMELAFLNGIRSSYTFPPRDPWLAGYAISYYYFGYVIIAMLADLAGTASSVAFNLGIALLFALTLLGSYGIVYNLVSAYHRRTSPQNPPPKSLSLTALLGALLVGVMGNLEGLFDLLHAINLPWIRPGFWRWLDILDINTPPVQRAWPPAVWRNWWWWRASRVIHDRTPDGLSFGLQPIAEFPFFSFLLGDMHPHVLALPFALLALGLAFNAAAQRDGLSKRQIALYAVVFGGLAFLNTWDLPFYLFVLGGALVLRQIDQHGWFEPRQIVKPALVAAGTAAGGLLLYLPWLVSFGSQAGGILPNAVFATRLHQVLVMFGPLLAVSIWFLIDEAVRRWRMLAWGRGIGLAAALLLALIALMIGLGLLVLHADQGARSFVVSAAGIPVEGLAPDQVRGLVPSALTTILLYRLSHPLTPLILIILIAVILALLLPHRLPEDTPRQPLLPSTGFTLVLVLGALLLILGPEFLYLRDNFGQRINTIFKFYYAAWIMLAVAAAYGAHILLIRLRPAGAVLFSMALFALVAAGMVYPALAIPTKANFADMQNLPTLDGLAFLRRFNPSEYAAIRWLQTNAAPGEIVLEAVGGSYTDYARISSATGLPTLLGWPGHESQWRGSQYSAYVGTRQEDIREIYNTPSITRAQELLDLYGVSYVIIGPRESSQDYASALGLAKFDRFLTAVFRADNIAIYRADLPLVEDNP